MKDEELRKKLSRQTDRFVSALNSATDNGLPLEAAELILKFYKLRIKSQYAFREAMKMVYSLKEENSKLKKELKEQKMKE